MTIYEISLNVIVNGRPWFVVVEADQVELVEDDYWFTTGEGRVVARFPRPTVLYIREDVREVAEVRGG